MCFDAGGMNLKPTGHIEDMQLDKGGAAAVVGAMDTLARDERASERGGRDSCGGEFGGQPELQAGRDHPVV